MFKIKTFLLLLFYFRQGKRESGFHKSVKDVVEDQSIGILNNCTEPWKTKSKSSKKKKTKRTEEIIPTFKSHTDEIMSVGKNFNNLMNFSMNYLL